MAKSYQHTRKKKEYAAIEIEKLKAEIFDIIGGMNMVDELSNEEYEKLSIRLDEVFDNRISDLKGE